MRVTWHVREIGDIVDTGAFDRMAGRTSSIVWGQASIAACRVFRKRIRQRARKLNKTAARRKRQGLVVGRLARSIKVQFVDSYYPNLAGVPVKTRFGAARVYGGARGSGAAYGVPQEYGAKDGRFPPTEFFSGGIVDGHREAFAKAAQAASIAAIRTRCSPGIGSSSFVKRVNRLSTD